MCISLGKNLCAKMMAAHNRLEKLTVIAIAFATVLVSVPALAFDPATDHTCVYNCGGGPAPSGGGYVAPVPRGPSPAELARRRQHAQAKAVNERGLAAFKGNNFAAAVRYFEQAIRLYPDDRNIQANYRYAKGRLAYSQHDYSSAANYFAEALRYSTGKRQRKELNRYLKDAQNMVADWPLNMKQDATYKEGVKAQQAKNWEAAERYFQEAHTLCTRRNRIDCGEISPQIHNALGLKATEQHDWDEAIREFEFEKNLYGKFELKNKLYDKKDKGHGLCGYYEMSPCADRVREAQKNIERVKAEKARQEKTKIEDRQKAEAKRRDDQQSNPNYPKPPPVYRDADTPRDIPDFKNMPAQHKAHADNNMGNVWAQKGDWVQALLSYQKALYEDPDGPFSNVIKENLDRAMKHLKDNQPKPATAVAQPPAAKPVQASQAKPEAIADSNCTRWANGSRVCADAGGHHYCEVQSGNSVSRVSCQ